jgi:hypothetical protein
MLPNQSDKWDRDLLKMMLLSDEFVRYVGAVSSPELRRGMKLPRRFLLELFSERLLQTDPDILETGGPLPSVQLDVSHRGLWTRRLRDCAMLKRNRQRS